MRIYLLACVLALAAISGQNCIPRQPATNNTDDTNGTGNNTGDNTGNTGNTGNNNTGNTDNTNNNTGTGTGNDGPQPIQDEHITGASSAKVTVIEYVDLQCPFCGRFARNTFPTIKQEYIQTGKVKWILRHFPLRSIHPYAQKAAEATECANNQGSFWKYTDLVFEKQSDLDGLIGANNDITAVLARLKQYAADLSLNTTLFNACLDGDSEAARVQRDLDTGTLNGACQEAANQGNQNCVRGTPTFFVNGTRHMIQTNDELAEVRSWLDAALAAAQ